MKRTNVAVFVLHSIWLGNLATGQEFGAENPLDEFMSRLSKPTPSFLALKITGHGGPRGDYVATFKANGGFGTSSIEGSTERRLIWNPSYVAQIERLKEGAWMCQGVTQANTDAYDQLIGNENLAGCFFGPLVKRLQCLEFVRLTNQPNQPDNSLYEYRYVPGCPIYSSDPALNSMSIRFDEESEKTRLLEIRHREGGDDVIIAAVTKFEYPKDSLFPLKRIGKAVVKGGEMNGSELAMEDVVVIDNELEFEPTECYLSHYGLPEPPFASKRIRWFWLPLVGLLVVGVGAYLWKRNASFH